MMPEYAGQQVGNYQLTRLLGRGGFATVYLGEHLYLKKQAAVKLLQVHMNPQDLQNFLKEAQIIARLEHDHIIRVLDFGIDAASSQPFFAMDYASRGSLRRVHPRGSILPLRTVVPYVQQIASALQYAHTQKIVHCDVKPENMLVASTNKIVLSDFGIAVTAHTTESVSKQNITGTALYMAPEQIRGKARPASDQYALGVVVYEWMCGVCPFEGATSIATMMSHVMDTPAPLRARVPSISQDVEDIVLKALAKDPQQRFPDIKEFAFALDDAQRSTQNRLKRTHFVSYTTHQLPPTSIEANTPTEPSKRTEIDPFTIVTTDPTSPSVAPRVLRAEFPFSSLSPDQKTITTGQEILESASARSATIVSRRTLVAGAVTLAALAAGGFAWSRFAGPVAQSKAVDPAPEPGKTFLVYRGHAGTVFTLGWSPDGMQIASGSSDQTIQIWDSATKAKFLTYAGHIPLPSSKAFAHPGSFVETLAWSPDGKWIASGGKAASMHVWNARTGDKLYSYPQKDLIDTIAWSHDGRWIASGGWEKTIHICEAMTGKTRLILAGHQDTVSSLDWSPDNLLLVSGSNDHTARIWDVNSEKTLYTYPGHSYAVKQAKWSPDGTKIASAGDNRAIHIWDFKNRNTIFIYDKHTESIKSLAWSPGGTKIASTGDDYTVQIWNPSNGNTLFTYTGHLPHFTIQSARWSPDGKRIASGGYDQTVRVWEAI